MTQFYPREVAFQRAVERARQHGNTVFVALAGTNDDLLPSEVEILYAQRERFGETQSRAIEQRCDQIRFSAQDRKSTRLNSSHVAISYAVFCLKKKTTRLVIYL